MKRVVCFLSALALAVGAFAPAAFASDLPVEFPDGNYDLDTVWDDSALQSLFLSQLGLYGASSELGSTFDWFERKYVEMMVAGIVGTGNVNFTNLVNDTLNYIHQESLPLPLSLSGHTFHLSYKPEVEQFIREKAFDYFCDFETEPYSGVYYWGKNYYSWTSRGTTYYSCCYLWNSSSTNTSMSNAINGWAIKVNDPRMGNTLVICTYNQYDSTWNYISYYYYGSYAYNMQGRAYTDNDLNYLWGYSGIPWWMDLSFMTVFSGTVEDAAASFYNAQPISPDVPNGEGYVFPVSINLDFGGFFSDNQSISNYYYTTYGDQITTGDVNYNQYVSNWSLYNITYTNSVPYWLVYTDSVPLEFNYNLELPTAELFEVPSDFEGGSEFWDNSFSALGGFGAFIFIGLSFGLVGLFFKD